MKLEEEILNLRQDLQCSQHVQQDLLKKMNNIKNANDIDRKAQVKEINSVYELELIMYIDMNLNLHTVLWKTQSHT